MCISQSIDSCARRNAFSARRCVVKLAAVQHLGARAILHPFMHTYIHNFIHINICMHICIHTCIHNMQSNPCIHNCIHICKCTAAFTPESCARLRPPSPRLTNTDRRTRVRDADPRGKWGCLAARGARGGWARATPKVFGGYTLCCI